MRQGVNFKRVILTSTVLCLPPGQRGLDLQPFSFAAHQVLQPWSAKVQRSHLLPTKP